MLPERVVAKLAGSLAGTILALVFIVPKTVSGFIRRIVDSLICGYVFGPSVHAYLAWPLATEHVMASTALASFLGWWGMGAVMHVARKLLGEKTPTE